MIFRTIEIFVVAGIITIISSTIFDIPALDLVVFALVMSPMALLQMSLNKLRTDFLNAGSIFFTLHRRLFSLCQTIFVIAFFWGMFYYAKANGIGTTIIYFFVGSIIQSAYYSFLKISILGEIVLIPLEILGLILFYSFVL